MKKMIFEVFVCMLLIGTVVPIVGSLNSFKPNNNIQIGVMADWTEIQKLLASDGAASDFFGSSVCLDGDTALIGAPQDDDNGDWSGSAYVFTRTGTTWTQQAKLLPSDGAAGDFFGSSVSLDGNTALIGAIYGDGAWGESGTAYIFTHNANTWSQQQKLLVNGPSDDMFGCSVSLYGDTALIGARARESSWSSGVAHVFTRTDTTWTEQQMLQAVDHAPFDRFGWSVSLDKDTALIGAVQNGEYGTGNGSAYVFTRTGTSWTQQAKLLASDGAIGDFFGWSVSLSQDTALVGACYHDENEDQLGAAYVFTRTGTSWTQQAKLLASDGVVGDYFGTSVSLSGDTALISNVNYALMGNAYVFIRTGSTWIQQDRLLASDGSMDFGRSVSLDGNTALIGKSYPGYENECGSAYVFKGPNQQPNKPTIDGPTSGDYREAHQWNITAIDPDIDDIFYFVEWGDGTNTGWSLTYNSGEAMAQSHTYNAKGTYTIKAKAKDISGLESDWGQLSVTMPCSYNIPFQSFWEKFFERFPYALPILRCLLGY